MRAKSNGGSAVLYVVSVVPQLISSYLSSPQSTVLLTVVLVGFAKPLHARSSLRQGPLQLSALRLQRQTASLKVRTGRQSGRQGCTP